MAGMNVKEKEILNRTRLDIIDSLDVKDIIDHLQADGVISVDKKDEIFARETRKHQCGLFLDILIRSGPVAYSSFKKALGSQYDFLQDAIHKVEEEVKFSDICDNDDYNYILAGETCKRAVRASISLQAFDYEEEVGYVSIDAMGKRADSYRYTEETTKCDDNDIYIVTQDTEGKEFDPYVNENLIYLSPSKVKKPENCLDEETNESQETKDELQVQTIAFNKNEYVVVRKSENPCITEAYTAARDKNVFVYNKYGRKARLPLNVLKKYGDPRGEPWFYPIPISSLQAALFLSSTKQKGCFLVYESFKASDQLPYNLSVCQSNEEESVKHYRIKRNNFSKLLSIETAHNSLQMFQTIHDLIEFHKKNKSALVTRLRRPLKYANTSLANWLNVHESQWEVDESLLELHDVCIGKGYFGVVKSGSFDGRPVAVKSLLAEPSSVSWQDDFFDEAELLGQLCSHENILKLIGTRFTQKPFYIITELIGKGNLKTCLRQKLINVEDVDLLYGVCLQLVSAMAYLESRRFILHRDVAARNCLLTDDNTVKLSDFGMARHVLTDSYEAPSDEKVAIQWASPEVLSNQVYSTKSDVWATAVVFWEIYSGGKKPYGDANRQETAKNVTSGETLPKPSDSCPDMIFEIMKECWQTDREKRPSFAIIHEQFVAKKLLYYEPVSLQEQLKQKAAPRRRPRHPSPPPRPERNSGDRQTTSPTNHNEPQTEPNESKSILKSGEGNLPPPQPSQPTRHLLYQPPTPSTGHQEPQKDSKTIEREQESPPNYKPENIVKKQTSSTATKKKTKYNTCISIPFGKKRSSSDTNLNATDKANISEKDHKSKFYTIEG